MAKTLQAEGDSADVIVTEPTTNKATYSIADFVRAAQKLFGQPGCLVSVALKKAGKSQYTIDEAKVIVEALANKPITN